MKIKVINILPHSPVYDCISTDWRPEICWDISNNSYVGFEGRDWADLIGNEVLKLENDIEYEVWQPDLRAAKIYSHQFENGLIHKLFPAKEIKIFFGFKRENQISSPVMLDALQRETGRINGKNVILHLNSIGYYLNRQVLSKFPSLPKLLQIHSKLSLPSTGMKKLRKNILGNLNYLKWHRELQENRKIFYVYNNSILADGLSRYNKIGIERIILGCDFDYWVSGDKDKAKELFNISPNTRVFSMASRLTELKQVDKVIKIFVDIDKNDRFDFKLLIAGYGQKEYVDYLKHISSELLNKNKILFTGYLQEEELLKLYQSSDLFISASTAEGGPVSVVKALACEIPVICTKVGGVDDILDKHKVGMLIPTYKYDLWYSHFIEILENRKKVPILERKIAKEIFDWKSIALKFIDIYKYILKKGQV
jgi:glycosyltransferase involved in cell wall biosynthesis